MPAAPASASPAVGYCAPAPGAAEGAARAGLRQAQGLRADQVSEAPMRRAAGARTHKNGIEHGNRRSQGPAAVRIGGRSDPAAVEEEARRGRRDDEILIEIETDKVVLEVPAPAAGVLAEIVKADGGTVVADEVIAQDRHRRQGRAPARCDRSVPPPRRARPRRLPPRRPPAAEVRRRHAGRRQDDGRQRAWPPARCRHRQGRPRHQGRRARARVAAGAAKPRRRAGRRAAPARQARRCRRSPPPVARRTWATAPSSACR